MPPARPGPVAVLGFLTATVFIMATSPALAHTSEQGFVLLLPTVIYIRFGVATVALTVLVLAILPARKSLQVFAHKALPGFGAPRLESAASLLSLALLGGLLWLGVEGPRDPLANLLPLTIWTLWWVGFVSLQGLAGDLWFWLNPWTGIFRLLPGGLDAKPRFSLPARLGSLPGILAFFAFASFFLADPAPDDPARLAGFVAGYWLYTLAAMWLFGAEDWLARGECFTMLLHHYASLSAFRRVEGRINLGLPGWRLLSAPSLSLSGGAFVLFILGTGTFDGLNETFWWLEKIGVNPLEFPGRSAIVWQTVGGLVAANALLLLVFSAVLLAGLAFVGEQAQFKQAFGRLARATLPIALAYHASHFVTLLMVNGQYAVAAASDPLVKGADYFGLGQFHVTTGFLNTRDTVEVIWLTQAGIIVVGHIIAVLISHAIAVDMFKDGRKATKSQIPMVVFMVLYTLIGLTLLASPRGA
jgi:hypothetical protein